tara:strand:- start:1849 stop:2466 length:618 start_codon:yes stop_codon:yes gene_type:complete
MVDFTSDFLRSGQVAEGSGVLLRDATNKKRLSKKQSSNHYPVSNMIKKTGGTETKLTPWSKDELRQKAIIEQNQKTAAEYRKRDALKKAAAKKTLEKGTEKITSGGSNKAALASTGLKLAGMESDSAGGGALEGGLQAAAMTGNPYIIAGAAVLGALQGSAKRKAHNKAMDAKAELGAAQAHATGAAQSQAAMGQMSRAFSQYFS